MSLSEGRGLDGSSILLPEEFKDAEIISATGGVCKDKSNTCCASQEGLLSVTASDADGVDEITGEQSCNEHWLVFTTGVLALYRSPIVELLNNSFSKLRNYCLKFALDVAQPEGIWHCLIGQVIAARTIQSLAETLLQIWCLCKPKHFRATWAGEKELSWLTYGHELVRKINFDNITLDIALSKFVEFMRHLIKNSCCGGKICYQRSLQWVQVALDRCIAYSSQIKASEHAFSRMSLFLEEQKVGDDDVDWRLAGTVAAEACATLPALGPGGSLMFQAVRLWLPEKALAPARAAGAVSGQVVDKALILPLMTVVGGVALSTSAPTAAVLALATFAFRESGNAAAFGIAAVMTSSAMANRGHEGDEREAQEQQIVWRSEFSGGLAVAQQLLGQLYVARGFREIKQDCRRLLGWNNLAVGPDGDVVEIVVWPCSHFSSDDVRFEFTVMPHITWDKTLDLISESGRCEKLVVNREVRRIVSKLYSLSRDWPLRLHLRKGIMPGIFKEVGEPWQLPCIIGGSLVRIIYVKANPHNC